MGSFGERLKRERELRSITLEEIAESTKIGTRFLAALEHEHFNKLPGGIFNKGFVRAYARYLGIDEEQAVADYNHAAHEQEQATPTPEAPQPTAEAEAGAEAWRLPRVAVAVAAVVVVLAAGAWWLNRGKLLSLDAVAGKPAALEPAQLRSQPPKPEAQPPAAAASEPEPQAAPPPEGFLLHIRAKQDAWVLVQIDGEPPVEDMIFASSERTFRARDALVLKVGNAAGVEISHNGRVLPPLGGSSAVRTVTFNREGIQQ